MDLHLRFTLDVPTGWSRRILHHVLVPVGLVAGMTTAVWAYDTSWIASGQPLSAAALKDDLDEIQSRLEALEGREPVYRATLGSSGELLADSGPWIDFVNNPEPGVFEIAFEDGVFAGTPTCVATPYLGNQVAPSLECYQAFDTGIVCASGTSGAGVETGVFLLCVGD